MSENVGSVGTATAEAVEELLRQLVDARFVLTDREGSVTRWSRPAEEVFGWPSARMLGRPLAETLALAGELPPFGGMVQTIARRKDGSELELSLTFVPVGMSQSLEFNGFLEALEIAAPRGNALGQLQKSHRTVVDWINSAVRGDARLDEEDLAAGTIVAFRPLVELPPLAGGPEDEPDEAAAGQAATAAAAGQIADAVEAALGRSDELERALEGTTAQLEAARGEAAQAAVQIAELRERGERTQAAAEEARELAADTRTLVERLERGLAEASATDERLSARQEEMRAQVNALGELPARIADVDALREQVAELNRLHERVADIEALRPGAGDEETAAQREQVRSELASVRSELDALSGERIEEQRKTAGELADTHAKLESLERAVAEEHQRAEEARALLTELRSEAAELRAAAARVASETGTGSSQAALSGEQIDALERLTVRAEEAVEAARSHSARASGAASAVEARASRAEEAAAAAEAHALRAAAGSAKLDERVATLDERAEAAVERAEGLLSKAEDGVARAAREAERAESVGAEVRSAAERAEAAAGSVERRAERVETAVQATDRNAARVDEHAAAVEAQTAAIAAATRKLEEIASSAEREAGRARAAAAAAEQAASAARQAAGGGHAEPTGSNGHARGNGHPEETRPLARFEPHPAEATGNGADAPRPLFKSRDNGPTREPRPGFDDAKEPRAKIALDGHFEELNQAFCDLVGYSEGEFRQAVWPPVMDRANLDKHRQQMKDMLDGRAESAEIDTGYVHAQGLLVPVVGTLSLIRENGDPAHFVLAARAT